MTTPQFRVVCTGSRSWDQQDPHGHFISNVLQSYQQPNMELLVAQGGAGGADRLVRMACNDLSVPCHTYAADWNIHSKRAGNIRNWIMLMDFKPDIVLAFWNGYSSGTRQCINTAVQLNIEVNAFILRFGRVDKYNRFITHPSGNQFVIDEHSVTTQIPRVDKRNNYYVVRSISIN